MRYTEESLPSGFVSTSIQGFHIWCVQSGPESLWGQVCRVLTVLLFCVDFTFYPLSSYGDFA